MRRPLKPFVTEYKGSRRATPSLAEAAPFESERPAPKAAETRTKSDPEDSYEAAMRAADALFAAPAQRPGDDRDTSPVAETFRTVESELATSERGGGRILRVLDEAPPPQYAALEAEFAPKRRGRKPGSKNKPKVPVLAAVMAAPVVQTSMSQPIESDLPAALQHAATRQVETTRVAVPAQRQVAALTTAASQPRNDRRYAWARDRLKPGEDWKRRRLPRVCW